MGPFLRLAEMGAPAVDALREALRRWSEGILAYFRHRFTHAVSEATDNQINSDASVRVLKRRAYRFFHLRCFFLRIPDVPGALPPLDTIRQPQT